MGLLPEGFSDFAIRGHPIRPLSAAGIYTLYAGQRMGLKK
jgi:hypothetical protein